MKYREHPYGKKRRWRVRLPWFFINLGFAKKGIDCETVNAKHHWYNIDNQFSGCYFCEVVKKGQMWKNQIENENLT